MNRRSFLQRAGATAATAAAATALPITAYASVPVTPQIQPAGVHVLGMPVTDAYQRIAKQMSDDVFDRALVAVRGRSFTLTNVERVEDVITEAWNKSIKVDMHRATTSLVPFDVEAFRRDTHGWTPGCVICPGTGGIPDSEVFRQGLTRVGLPFLPVAMLWTAHYIDEATGFAMRALAQFDIVLDLLVIRWDVLCG